VHRKSGGLGRVKNTCSFSVEAVTLSMSSTSGPGVIVGFGVGVWITCSVGDTPGGGDGVSGPVMVIGAVFVWDEPLQAALKTRVSNKTIDKSTIPLRSIFLESVLVASQYFGEARPNSLSLIKKDEGMSFILRHEKHPRLRLFRNHPDRPFACSEIEPRNFADFHEKRKKFVPISG